jgi:hypothetical protein
MSWIQKLLNPMNHSQWKLLLIDKTEKTMGVTKYGYSKKSELTEITCVRMGSAKVLITVILPTYDNSLWIHEFNTDLTFLNFILS